MNSYLLKEHIQNNEEYLKSQLSIMWFLSLFLNHSTFWFLDACLLITSCKSLRVITFHFLFHRKSNKLLNFKFLGSIDFDSLFNSLGFFWRMSYKFCNSRFKSTFVNKCNIFINSIINIFFIIIFMLLINVVK